MPGVLQDYLAGAQRQNWHGEGHPPLVLLDGAVGRASEGGDELMSALGVCSEYKVPALVVWGALPAIQLASTP